MNDIQKTAKAYKIKQLLVKIAAILAMLAAFFMLEDAKLKLFAASVVFITAYYVILLLKGTISRILFTDCDPQRYYEVCRAIAKGREDTASSIAVSLFTGEYRKCISLCTEMLKPKLPVSAKLYYYRVIATASFEGGDFQHCRDTCQKLLSLADGKGVRKSYAQLIKSRCGFYLSFISCDYDSALKHLNACMQAKRQHNSYKATMQYYKGITLYYSGKTEQARLCFAQVLNAPKFKLAELAGEYIESIDTGVIKTIVQENLAPQEDAVPAQQIPKMPKAKKIILLLLIFVFLLCGTKISTLDTGVFPDVLSRDEDFSVASVEKTFSVDKDYYICIFTTDTHQIGVSYMKSLGDNKYKAPLKSLNAPESFTYAHNVSYIYLSGNAYEVFFDITDDKSKIPEGSKAEEFSAFGETYYFYYSLGEKKYRFWNSTGIILEK